MKKYYDHCGVEIKAGYRMWNGHIMTTAEANHYNGFTKTIEIAEQNKNTCKAELYKNLRHKFTLTLV